MSFLIKVPLGNTYNINIFTITEKLKLNSSDNISLYCYNNPGGKIRAVSNEKCDWYLIGDFIIPDEFKYKEAIYLKKYTSGFNYNSLRNSKGNFYIIHIDRENSEIKVYNSILGILPVYYHESSQAIYISSRIDLILQSCTSVFKIQKKYICEHVLFGYSFQNNTLIKEIRLLPANQYLQLKNREVNIISHTSLLDYFVTDPTPWKKSLEALSDLFIEQVVDYLPDSYYSSLTGGLDGRTLLALGLFKNKDIKTYSYGSEKDKDVLIPASISSKLGIPFQPIILDESYAEENFLHHARKGGTHSEGNLRFSRSQYNFLAEKFMGATGYLVTGNFGSELMRTMRLSGNLISHAIFDLFQSQSYSKFKELILKSHKLRYLKRAECEKEIYEIIDEAWLYKQKLRGLSINQQFYTYLLEEIFRKYFGPEIVTESFYLINRTPFLDFKFIAELFKSELAGCNGNFRENNPFDRFKGQALYPHIIHKTYPQLLEYKLDRGYAPKNFLSRRGHYSIAIAYFKKKYLKGKTNKTQPSYNELMFSHNITNLQRRENNYDFLNTDRFNSLFIDQKWIEDHINFNIYLSLLDHLDHILDTYNNVEFE